MSKVEDKLVRRRPRKKRPLGGFPQMLDEDYYEWAYRIESIATADDIKSPPVYTTHEPIPHFCGFGSKFYTEDLKESFDEEAKLNLLDGYERFAKEAGYSERHIRFVLREILRDSV